MKLATLSSVVFPLLLLTISSGQILRKAPDVIDIGDIDPKETTTITDTPPAAPTLTPPASPTKEPIPKTLDADELDAIDPHASPIEPSPSPTPPPPAGPKVVTLGDSYASGTGIHRNDSDYDQSGGGVTWFQGIEYQLTARSDNECWRETDTTPGPMLASANGQTSVFVACKGAEELQVMNQWKYLNARYSLDAAARWEGSIILLTAGGNDVRTHDEKVWHELARVCITELNPFNGCDNHSGNQVANFASIQARLTTLFTKIAAEASNARIRIMGYPKIMQPDPGCGSVTGVSRDEADWMDDNVIALNIRISNAVDAAKSAHPSVDIEFVSVYNFLTVGACGNRANNRHVHNTRLTRWGGTSDSSFHPSQKGYNEYYSALLASLV